MSPSISSFNLSQMSYNLVKFTKPSEVQSNCVVRRRHAGGAGGSERVSTQYGTYPIRVTQCIQFKCFATMSAYMQGVLTNYASGCFSHSLVQDECDLVSCHRPMKAPFCATKRYISFHKESLKSDCKQITPLRLEPTGLLYQPLVWERRYELI